MSSRASGNLYGEKGKKPRISNRELQPEAYKCLHAQAGIYMERRGRNRESRIANCELKSVNCETKEPSN